MAKNISFTIKYWKQNGPQYQGDDTKTPELIKEPLEYEAIKVQTRNYKN